MGDWYAVDLVLNRRQFILAVSSESRIAVVVPAAPYSTFPSRLPVAVADVLVSMQVTAANIASEVNEMQDIFLAKTESRSIIGSMNDYRKHLEMMAELGRLNIDHPHMMSLRLSGTPSLVMPGVWPQKVTMKLFGQPEQPPAKMVGNPFKKPSLVLVK